jgi:hypothetical protein
MTSLHITHLYSLFRRVFKTSPSDLFSLLSGPTRHPTVPLAQASLVMKELTRIREKQPKLPIILCGDFNSSKQSMVREYILHGMPDISHGDGGTLKFFKRGVPFSDVWEVEFNQRFEWSKDVCTRSPDCCPWQQLWFGSEDHPALLPNRFSDIFSLADAFQNLHDVPEAFTIPGEDIIADHMYALVLLRIHGPDGFSAVFILPTVFVR